MFIRALNFAPPSRRGRMVFKWNIKNRDYDLSAFTPAYLTSDILRSDLDLVSLLGYLIFPNIVVSLFIVH